MAVSLWLWRFGEMPQGRRKKLGQEKWQKQKKVVAAMACENGLAAIKARAGLTAKQASLVAVNLELLKAKEVTPPAAPQWRNAKASRPSRQQSARHLQNV